MYKINKLIICCVCFISVSCFSKLAWSFDFQICNNTTLDAIYVATVFDDLDTGTYSQGWKPVGRGACVEMNNHHGPEVYLRIVGDNGTLLSVPRSQRDTAVYCRQAPSNTCYTAVKPGKDSFIYYREDRDTENGKIVCRKVEDPCKIRNKDYCYDPDKTYSFFDSRSAMLDMDVCNAKFQATLGTFQYYHLERNNDTIIIVDKNLIK